MVVPDEPKTPKSKEGSEYASVAISLAATSEGTNDVAKYVELSKLATSQQQNAANATQAEGGANKSAITAAPRTSPNPRIASLASSPPTSKRHYPGFQPQSRPLPPASHSTPANQPETTTRARTIHVSPGENPSVAYERKRKREIHRQEADCIQHGFTQTLLAGNSCERPMYDIQGYQSQKLGEQEREALNAHREEMRELLGWEGDWVDGT